MFCLKAGGGGAGTKSRDTISMYPKLTALTGAPADDFREKGLANTGITDKDCAGPVLKELQIEQPQDSSLLFRISHSFSGHFRWQLQKSVSQVKLQGDRMAIER